MSAAFVVNKTVSNTTELSVTDKAVKYCCDCLSWVGRCKKGYVGRIAKDKACRFFAEKQRSR